MPVKTYNPGLMETGEILFQAETCNKVTTKSESFQYFVTPDHITTQKMTPRAKAWFVFKCPCLIRGVLMEVHPESFKKLRFLSKQNSSRLRP